MPLHIETQPIADVKAGAWDAWMARYGAADFQHYYGYGAAMMNAGAHAGTRALFLRILEAGNDMARGLFMQQRFGPITLTYAPRGLVLAHPDARPQVYKALQNMASVWRGKFIVFSPSLGMADAFQQSRPIISGQSEAVIDLRGGIDAVKSGFKQKWRNRLHKAQAADLQISLSGLGRADAAAKEGADWIVDEELGQRKRKGYRALPADLPQRMAQAKGKVTALSITAKYSGEHVAGANFILNGAFATYFSGITTPKGRDHCAQHLVLFTAAQRLLADGYKTLSLGVLDTHRAPGLARFKLGTGAQKHAHAGTFLIC